MSIVVWLRPTCMHPLNAYALIFSTPLLVTATVHEQRHHHHRHHRHHRHHHHTDNRCSGCSNLRSKIVGAPVLTVFESPMIEWFLWIYFKLWFLSVCHSSFWRKTTLFRSARTSSLRVPLTVRSSATKIPIDETPLNYYITMSDLSNHVFSETPTIHWRSEMTKAMTNTHLHEFEVLQRPIMCYIYIPMWHGGHGHGGHL